MKFLDISCNHWKWWGYFSQSHRRDYHNSRVSKFVKWSDFYVDSKTLCSVNKRNVIKGVYIGPNGYRSSTIRCLLCFAYSENEYDGDVFFSFFHNCLFLDFFCFAMLHHLCFNLTDCSLSFTLQRDSSTAPVDVITLSLCYNDFTDCPFLNAWSSNCASWP